MRFSAENDTNYGTLKSVIEKTSQTGKRCRYLHQTHFIGRHRRRQKTKIKRGSVRTICLSKCPNRTGNERGVIGLASNSNHTPPGQALDSIILTKRWGSVMHKDGRRV